MPDKISIQEAQGKKLEDLISGLAPGAELVITDDERPIAKLVAESPSSPGAPRRQGGQLKGQIVIADDFDQLPGDIAEAFGAGDE